MKTLGFTGGLLLLLLLAVYHCTAKPHALTEIQPASCCFEFFTDRIPQQQIVSIVKTHSSCRESAFVVGTAKGYQICVRQNQNWAQKLFKKQQNDQYK